MAPWDQKARDGSGRYQAGPGPPSTIVREASTGATAAQQQSQHQDAEERQGAELAGGTVPTGPGSARPSGSTSSRRIPARLRSSTCCSDTPEAGNAPPDDGGDEGEELAGAPLPQSAQALLRPPGRLVQSLCQSSCQSSCSNSSWSWVHAGAAAPTFAMSACAWVTSEAGSGAIPAWHVAPGLADEEGQPLGHRLLRGALGGAIAVHEGLRRSDGVLDVGERVGLDTVDGSTLRIREHCAVWLRRHVRHRGLHGCRGRGHIRRLGGAESESGVSRMAKSSRPPHVAAAVAASVTDHQALPDNGVM